MTKISYPTEKFYMGYPVFIVMTTDENGEVLLSTMSSSYSLRDKFIMGAAKEGNTAQHLIVGQKLSINFLSGEQGLFSDIGGMSRRVRMTEFIEAGGKISLQNDVPTFENAPLTLIGEVGQIVEDELYFHLFIKIEQRLIENSLLKEGKIDWTRFCPLEYVGDGKRRHYKKVEQAYKNDGDYLKANRTSKRQAHLS